MSPDEIEQHRRRVLDDQAAVMRAIGVEWPPVDESPTPEQREHSALVTPIARQDRALAEQAGELQELRARLYRREEELREARAVLVLLLTSRVYLLMRLIGRWGWLEHRIRRALW